MPRYIMTSFAGRMRNMSEMFEDPDLDLSAKEMFTHIFNASMFEIWNFVEDQAMAKRIKYAILLNRDIDVFGFRRDLAKLK